MSLSQGIEASQKEADLPAKDELFSGRRIASCWAEANALSVETFVKESYKINLG
jgi:hypothetical protein